jgi:hypothetical protein
MEFCCTYLLGGIGSGFKTCSETPSIPVTRFGMNGLDTIKCYFKGIIGELS